MDKDELKKLIAEAVAKAAEKAKAREKVFDDYVDKETLSRIIG